MPLEPRSSSSLKNLRALTTVLVVDDHSDMREVVSLLLQHHGFRVRVACDGQEAVELARSSRPDVVLMDLSMPRMDGFRAAEALNGTDAPAIPVIAVTAREITREELEPLGFCGLLRKPVGVDALVDAVRACMDGDAPTRRWISNH